MLKTKITKLNAAQWTNGLLICTVLATSALVGLRSYQYFRPEGFFLPGWAFLLFGGLGAFSICLLALHNIAYALTLLVCASAVVTASISTGTQSPLNVTIVLVAGLTGVWCLRMIASDKRLWLVPSTLNGPLLGFLFITVLAWLAGYAISDWRTSFPPNAFQVQAGQFAMFALSAAAFFLTANHSLNKKTLIYWTWIIILLGIVAIGSDVLKIRSNPLPAVKGALQMWPFVLLLSHLLFNPDIKRKYYLLGWPILGLWAYWAFFTPTFYTKGLWVPALIAMALLVAIRLPKLSLILGGAGVLILIGSGSIQQTVLGEFASGVAYRPLIWQDVLQMTSSNWLLGLGPANYMYYWQSLGLDSLTLQYALENRPWMAPQWATYIVVPSHNMYVDILAQTGVIGLLFFLAFLIVAVRFGWRLRKRFQPGFYQAHIYGVVCGFACIAIGSFWFADWLIPFVYNITISGFRHSVYSWLLLGTLVSIDYFVEDTRVEGTH